MMVVQDPQAMNPVNVPPIKDVRWTLADREKSSPRQQELLSILLESEGIRAQDLFGGGFSSISELSKWAAHWGISFLEDAISARVYEEARLEIEQRRDQEIKRWIASYYRSKASKSDA